MSKYSVYKHTFPNGKVYIGITSQTLEKRFAGGNGYKKCPKIHNAILKYGWENVEHELLFSNLSKQEAEAKEIELIAFYNSVPNGYNADHGGNVPGTHSIETRAKISMNGMGKKKPPFSDERKLSYSAKFSGENNPFHGKHHTEEVKEKQREFMRGNQFNKGNHHTEEYKAWKSQQMRGKYSDGGNPRCRPVIQTDCNGKETKFNSLRSAAAAIGKSAGTLLNHLSDSRPYCGYLWRYENETGS